MAADSVHASVEKNMKKRKNVFDFSDFEECVSAATNNAAVQLGPNDFLNWLPLHSAAKMKLNNHLSV
jgi:hypothetical protein